MYVKFRDNNNTTHLIQVMSISFSEKEGGTLSLAGITGAGVTYWESVRQISVTEFEHIQESLVKDKFYDLTECTVMDFYNAELNTHIL